MKISVIIATRNAASTLEACLKSIKEQTRKPDEIIVIDRDSMDATKEIAKKYTKQVFNTGPERSAQRNFGAKRAIGDYLLFIDADMELTEKVIEEAEQLVIKNTAINAISIPEKSFGQGFWAEVKAFERSFYIGEDQIEAPRFIARQLFLQIGGYDEKLIAGEDWDLRNRLNLAGGQFGRINEMINHNEGYLSLSKTAFKKYYYGRHIKNYLVKGKFSPSQVLPFRMAFFKHPGKLLQRPDKTIGLFILRSVEYFAGSIGLILSLVSRQRKEF